jgi:hypothetical protein
MVKSSRWGVFLLPYLAGNKGKDDKELHVATGTDICNLTLGREGAAYIWNKWIKHLFI